MGIVELLFRGVFYIEGLALIVGLIFIKKYWKTPSFLIVIYVGLVYGVEFFGLRIENNQWLYNLLGFSELLLVATTFYLTTKEGVSKKIILVLTFICAVFLLCDSLFITQSFYKYLSYAFGFVSLGISTMCLIYLFELTRTEKVLYQGRTLLYWVSIGLLVYHLCNLPITVLSNKLIEIGNSEALLSIQSISCIVMYSCFIIGFIWSKRKYNI